MIKFFRKIRQQLLNSGEMKKYFLYAIGEILLVVIGILIALQINTWNENRKSQIIEQKYLLRLKSELISDTLSFSEDFERYQIQNQKAQAFANELNKQNNSDTLLFQTAQDYFSNAWSFPFFNPNTSTFEDLSNTGNLIIISNEDLRQKIIQHYGQYRNVRIRINGLLEGIVLMDNDMILNTDALKWDTQLQPFFTNPSIQPTVQHLFENRDYLLKTLANNYFIKKVATNYLSELKINTTIILQEINKELENQ